MPQKYKVFFNHNVVYISNQFQNSGINSNKIINPDEVELKNFLTLFCTSKSTVEFQLIYDNLKNGWQLFKEHFEVRKAAGGLVVNENKDILFIKRNGFWDLPKGHIEKGEKKKAAAIREVQEECGITNIQIERKLITTYHSYFIGQQLILKPSHWYVMKHDANEPLIPQTKEGITEVKWINAKNVAPYLEESFPSIKDVIDAYLPGRK